MPWWLARSRPVLVLALLVAFTSSARAEVCKGSKVKKADLAVYDHGVDLTPTERDAAIPDASTLRHPKLPEVPPAPRVHRLLRLGSPGPAMGCIHSNQRRPGRGETA